MTILLADPQTEDETIPDLEARIAARERRHENVRAAADTLAVEQAALALELNELRRRLRDAQAARLAVAA